ncbi:MAG: hypothetical protein KBT34_10275 [Prevotella sp.]|nr:hypothetical protein [Candidatus Prevotella equi]
MTSINVKSFNNPKGYTQYNEVVEALGHCGSVIKHVCGIAYAMSYYTMLDAIDYIKKDGLYKQTVKQKVNDVMKERENYISRLKSPAPGEAEFFNLKYLQPEARRRYRADLTNEEYFQTWLDMGASSYKGYKPMIDALQHKYFKSLSERGVKHAKAIAWCITTEVTLEIAVEAYNTLLKELRDGRGLPIDIINMEFAPFCLINVHEKWCEALKQIYPSIEEYEKSVHGDRNITMGINDLKEAFSKEISTTNAIRESVEDNADIFATKGFFKKEMTKIAETEQELINQKSA